MSTEGKGLYQERLEFSLNKSNALIFPMELKDWRKGTFVKSPMQLLPACLPVLHGEMK